MWSALIIGLCSAGVLLVAGYLYGVGRGFKARNALRIDLEQRQSELGALRAELSRPPERTTQPESLRDDLGQMLAPLLRQGEAVQRLQGQLQNLSQSLAQREEEQQALKGNCNASSSRCPLALPT